MFEETDFSVSLWWLGLTDETTEGQWVWFDTDDIAIFTGGISVFVF